MGPHDLAATWTAQLTSWLQDATAFGIDQANAMSLATVDPDGRPSVRTVLCKSVDERGIVFYTNRLSRKGNALRGDPRAAVVFPWVAMMRQVCVTGDVEEVTRAETETYFRSRPVGARRGAWASRQSSVIGGREELDRRDAELATRFGDDVPVPEFWGGFRLLPLAVEFWAAGENRLHDRLRLRRVDGSPGLASDRKWVLERLSP